MYCRDCGYKLDDAAVICPQCGRVIKRNTPYEKDTGAGTGWGILAFFIPIVGLILAVVYFNKRKDIAYGSCKGVLVRTCVSIVFSIIYGIIVIVSVITGTGILPNNPPISGTNPPSSENTTPGGTGPGWNSSPTDNDSPTNSFIYPAPPSPSKATYNNSDDGVLTFFVTKENCPTFYDVATNTVVAYDWDELYVYDATSGAKRYEHFFGSDRTIKCVTAYGGKVAVGFGQAQELCVLNLDTLDLDTYPTTIDVFEVELTDDAVLYADNDQWCEVHMLSLTNGMRQVIISGVYRPRIAVNREKGILYVAETGLSSCNLIYVNIATKEASGKAEFGQYSYSNYDAVYDGTYLHAMGNLYDATKGNIVEAGQCAVKDQSGWSPYSTLCTDGKYSLTVTTDCKTAVYNSESKKIEYTMDLYATRIYAIGNSKYVAVCGSSGYYALIDLNKM